MRTRTIAWFLRDPANAHYLSTLRPLLDQLSDAAGVRHHLVVSKSSAPADDRSDHPIPDDLADLLVECTDLDGNDLDGYDLVVTPTWLREHERPRTTPVVQTFHGLSDKPFTVERDFSRDTALLCIGVRHVERLLRNHKNRRSRCHLVGWPKFDRMPRDLRRPGARPRVVYAPTWRKAGFSSMDAMMSPGVLDALRSAFDVVIKPHPNLLNPARPFYDHKTAVWLSRIGSVDGVRVVRTANVLPEFAAADLCVTDASSAGHEWLYFDRPLVILNPRPGELQAEADCDGPTYLWRAAQVCDDPHALTETALGSIEEDNLGQVRRRLLRRSVHDPYGWQAAARGAAVIASVLRS